MRHSRKGTPKSKSHLGSLLLTFCLLLLPLVNANVNFSFILDFIGRFHPVVVHFPIVLILFTVVLEWLFGSFKGPIGLVILKMSYNWSLYSAVISALLGYLLYRNGDYGGQLIQFHMWSGIMVSILLIWCNNFRRRYGRTHRWRWRQMSRTLLLLAAIFVIITGHQGGSLTHGPDFLTEPITKARYARQVAETQAQKNPEGLQIYRDILLPTFEQKCMKCHNAQNSKSDLDLSSYNALRAGGKSLKPMIVEGDPEESELLRRVLLPPKHDDFMPPDGKPPLLSAEVRILSSWIRQGAGEKDTLGGLHLDDTLNQMLEGYLSGLAQAQVSKKAERLHRLKTGPKLIRIAADWGLEIRPDETMDSAYYTVSMLFPPKIITDETIAALMPYKDYFSKLSLVSADISDEGLFYIGQMKNLREVILTKSCITGSGLNLLKELPYLEMLNLSHTDLNNENLLYLTQFPSLKKVYLFNTFVTKDFIKIMDAHMPDTEITLQEGDYY